LQKFEKVVPDTSVIIEGIISKQIEAKELSIKTIIIHEAVIAELESQANKNRETGYLGLDEIEKIRKISEKKKIKLEFNGQRPGDFEIKFAKSGEIDSLIRELANKEKATLFTGDIVQAKVAEAKGIHVFLYEFSNISDKKMIIEKYFDKNTISIQIKENCKIFAKKGEPGNIKTEYISSKDMSKDEIRELSKNIIETAKCREDSFIDSEKKGSTIIKVGKYKIAIVRPSFAKGYEINVIRQIKKIKFEEYSLPKSFEKNILKKNSGVLVVGSIGSGKSTFVQAVANRLLIIGKEIKTIETPRSLELPEEIAQYNLNDGSSNEIKDIFSINKPDFVVFDELKNTEELRLFSDLRIMGISVFGTMVSKNLVGALQRFVKKMDLRMICDVVDTIVFIKNGKIKDIYHIDASKKLLLMIKDSNNKTKFQIRVLNQEIVVIPV